MELRKYQKNILSKIIKSKDNVVVQLDTGAGKTPIIAELAKIYKGILVVAHRQVLIIQASEKLAAIGVIHNVIAPKQLVRDCITTHRRQGYQEVIDTFCKTHYVASIDTLLLRKRKELVDIPSENINIIIIDEAHHCLDKNKWGKLRGLYPNARIIGFTATPCRADGQSLHITKEGIFDRLIQADSLISNSINILIKDGYLSDFKLYSIISNYNQESLTLGKNGDYTIQSLQKSIKSSAIVGDAVKHYTRLAKHTPAIVMCVSIKNAEETAETFRAFGYRSSYISSSLSHVEVQRRLDAFRAKEIEVICNVDMVGEGFDFPAVKTLIMLRKTASFVLYRQWVGRSLRPLEGKEYAIILDHVGNVITHGLPDRDIKWDLLHPERMYIARQNLYPCPECGFTYYAWKLKCPECGHKTYLRVPRIGKHYVTQSIIDIELCELKRKQIQLKKDLETKVVIPGYSYGTDSIGKTCNNLREIMVSILGKYDIPPVEINSFLRNVEISREFWIKNFTINDTKNIENYKFLKVYKKWKLKL